jgi:AcrR family transcriptional regulator
MRKRSYDIAGRAAKAAATRERIRESALQLYIERSLEDFTLDEVARRAGTTVQTVLRVFTSKDRLFFAALELLAEQGVPLKPTAPGDVAAAVSAMYDLYETTGDLLIQRLNDERRHPALKRTLDEGRKHHRDWVKRAFAPQLAEHHGATRAQLFNIIVVATDLYVWKILRRDIALGRSAAEATVRKMIAGVTGTEELHGTNSLAELVGRR